MSTHDDASGRVAHAVFVAVAVVIASTVGAAVGVATVGADDTATAVAEDEYAVAQGDRCIAIEPIADDDRTVEEYYDYRNPHTDPDSYTYSSHGTTHLQEDDTSILFLYEGSDGLSLVLVHDRYDGDSEGGAVTMQFENLPEDGEWVVEDDDYPDRDDEFDHRETSSRITWVWSEARTDGGAFNGGLDDEFAIEVTPAFNDRADFRLYDGEITDWQVLSAPDHDPERTSLAMDEPIVVRSGGCTAVTGLDVADSATVGEDTDVTATVANEGEREATVTVPFVVDGEVVDEQEVTVEPGETATVSTVIAFDEAGDRTLSAGEASADVDVSEAPNQRMAGFGIAAVAVAALVVVLLVRSRR